MTWQSRLLSVSPAVLLRASLDIALIGAWIWLASESLPLPLPALGAAAFGAAGAGYWATRGAGLELPIMSVNKTQRSAELARLLRVIPQDPHTAKTQDGWSSACNVITFDSAGYEGQLVRPPSAEPRRPLKPRKGHRRVGFSFSVGLTVEDAEIAAIKSEGAAAFRRTKDTGKRRKGSTTNSRGRQHLKRTG